ncbi:MAG: T9SS type A sorting domain-containing protein [Candidatus Marinimicrobia bacterium]|nr:T9SS type A sorting domain-containing protein [Candidatus Neomarinimicrobiota bacterium]
MRRCFVTVLFFLVSFVLLSSASAQTAVYDTISIHDLQYVPNPDSSQDSYYHGDTVVVKGLVQHGPRELWIGARWSNYITEPLADPWSGILVLQNDTFEVNTLYSFVQEGDEVYFTGVMADYSGITQLAILTNPVTPVTIVSYGNTLPEPKLLTLADLATHNAGEQWESQYVRVENVTITNNSYVSNQAVITDGTSTGYIDDYFMYFRGQFDQGSNPWAANGTRLNIQGFVRDVGMAFFTINPRDDSDIEILTNPPEISTVRRDIGTPTSSDVVTVSAVIIDNLEVDSAQVHYSVDCGDFVSVTMTAIEDTFSAQIPIQANNSFMRYFISAVDNEGDFSQVPGDTTERVYHYVIRDEGLDIKDVQFTWGYSYDGSGYVYFPVALEGVVTTDSTDWVNNYYIQEKDSAWYGIWIYDATNKPKKGDWVRVTGTVEENYGVTRLSDITSFEVVTADYGVFDPILVTTGEITTGGVNAEAYESILIQVENLTITDPFPDSPGNYGEFEVDDGSGPLRVDDAMSAFGGNLDSTFALNETIEKIIAIHYYSYGDYKLLPRDTLDIVGHITHLDESQPDIIDRYNLGQNFPNPFNMKTSIRFSVPEFSPVSITIYNILGKKVRTLYDGRVAPGVYEVQWNGLDYSGLPVSSGLYFYRLQGNNFTDSKKMLFLK